MKILSTCLFFSLVAVFLHAQPLREVPYPMMIETAEESMMQRDYYNALHWYEEAYKEVRDPVVRYKIAQLQYKLRDYKRAERYYNRVVRDDEENRWPEAVLDYARILKINEKYQESIDAFNALASITENDSLLAIADREVAGIQLAAKTEAPIELVIENVGRKVNSSYSDLSPKLSPEGDLYFASMPSKDVIVLNGEEGDYFGKIFVSKWDDDEWDRPDALGGQINREGFHTGNPAFNRGGNILYFTRALLDASDVAESKIYMSYLDGSRWGAPREIEGDVNGDYISTYPCAGELYGEDVIIFSSNMPGGEGGMDLYYATKEGEYTFGLPVNLGPGINTPQDEVTPYFINNILYFSSDGHPSFGGLDIFSVEWNGANWESPKNMGAGYNTGTDDYYYTVNLEGKKGFLVSNRPADDARSVKSKTCCDDIYSFDLRDLVIDLRALVFDKKDNSELPGATVSLFEILKSKPVNPVSKTNADSNNFAFLLDPDKSYKAVVEREGYFPDEFSFNTVGKTENETFKANVYLERDPSYETGTEIVTINQPIRLNNIYYDFDDDKILPDAEKDLSYLLELMNKYPDMDIELSSHTDARGNDRYNQRLSQRRAQSATNWLIERGVDPERIEAVGYGESQILNHCTNGVQCTDDEHRFNRRTEFKIIAGPTSIEVKKEEFKGDEKKN